MLAMTAGPLFMLLSQTVGTRLIYDLLVRSVHRQAQAITGPVEI